MSKPVEEVPAVTAETKTESSLLNAPVSCYRGVDPKNREGEKLLAEVLEIIKTKPVPEQARIRELKCQLRGLKPETPEYTRLQKQHEALKKGLFGFTPSGICRNGRADKELTSYNGIVLADFDELENEAEREKLFDLLKRDPHILAVWRSVSGFGVKALVAGQPQPQLHGDNFAAAAEHMLKLTGRQIDPACKNISRFCFAGHDPELWVNQTIALIEGKKKSKEPTLLAPLPISEAKLARLKVAIEQEGSVGEIEWATLNGKPVGFCHCPDPQRKHPKATLYLTNGLPTLHCHHEKCAEYVADYNDWLRATWTEMYFEPRDKFWLRRANPEKWMTVYASGAKAELARLGVWKNDRDALLHDVRRHRTVEYAGPLAGYRSGIYNMFGDEILVTKSPIIPEPVRGQWRMMRKFLSGLFTKDQREVFQAWIRLGYEAVRAGEPRPGQALGLVGPAGCGKSLLQALITVILGGRVAHPYQFMSGATPFNAELFGAEHLSIEDEKPSTDYTSRRHFGTALKNLVVNQEQTCYRKFATPVALKPVWRVSMSVNDDPEALQVFPAMDNDIADKLILLQTTKSAMPMKTGSPAERKAFWDTLVSELPAFLFYITRHWQIPTSLLEGEWAERYGMDSFKHPDVLRALSDLAPETHLLELIDEALFTPPNNTSSDVWEPEIQELTSREVEQKIRSRFSDRLYEVNKILKGPNSCRNYLGRLASKSASRVQRVRTKHDRKWRIYPPTILPEEQPM